MKCFITTESNGIQEILDAQGKQVTIHWGQHRKANSQAQVPLYKTMETERAKLGKSVGNIAAPMEGESNLLDQHYRRPVKYKRADPL